MTLESPLYTAITVLTLVAFVAALALIHLDATDLFYGADSYFSYIGKK